MDSMITFVMLLIFIGNLLGPTILNKVVGVVGMSILVIFQIIHLYT